MGDEGGSPGAVMALAKNSAASPRSSSFPLLTLPNELQQEIVFAVARDGGSLHAWGQLVCCILPELPHLGLTAEHMVDRFFRHEALIIDRHYAFHMFLPCKDKCLIKGFDSDQVPHAYHNDSMANGSYDDHELEYLNFDEVTPMALDFAYLCYLSICRSRIEAVCDALADLAGLSFSHDERLSLQRLWRFLGPHSMNSKWSCRPDGQVTTLYQSRFDYLATLSSAQRREMDELLDRIVGAIAHQFRSAPPTAPHPLAACWRHDADAPGEGKPRIGRLDKNIPWSKFTHSGMYQACLKSLLVGISFEAWVDFFYTHPTYSATGNTNLTFPVSDPVNLDGKPASFRDSSYTWRVEAGLYSRIPQTVDPEPGTSNIRLLPDPQRQQSFAANLPGMHGFACDRPLWTWNTAVAMPDGVAFNVHARQRPIVTTGADPVFNIDGNPNGW